MAKPNYIGVGEIFHLLTYTGNECSVKGKGRCGKFRCECGIEKLFRISKVVSGETKSCGCRRINSSQALMSRHGKSLDGAGSAYKSWRSMMDRCYNPRANNYNNYGQRGIKVCERWRYFENFLADMGHRPNGASLDRWPDQNGHYEPGNCRWATKEEQENNRRDTRIIEFDGLRLSITQWARKIGIDRSALSRRIDKNLPLSIALSPGRLPRK